jgi:regulator of protease activity HflC (stomatin/prohibitin superfamily)
MDPNLNERRRHHPRELGLPPPFQYLKGDDMTLEAGTRALAARRTAERTNIMAAISEAEALFSGFEDGVAERDLIRILKEDRGYKQRIAAAAVDRLEASGKARKDWETGFLTQP